jgi:integrase
MNHVTTITKEQADALYMRLPSRSKLIFSIGIETGLRISDILNLKIRDIENPLRVYVGRIQRVASFKISDWLYNELSDLIDRYPCDRYIFPARKKRRHLHRTTYHRDIKLALFNLKFSCSAHSTRKFFLSTL